MASSLLPQASTAQSPFSLETKAALEATLDGVTGALKEGDQVQLIGFGTFKVNERAARTGRNPRTGEEIHIAAAKVPAFKASKTLKEAVNS
mgnify:CR=1 FL=1